MIWTIDNTAFSDIETLCVRKETIYSSFPTAGVYDRINCSMCLLNTFCSTYILKTSCPSITMCRKRINSLWTTHRVGKLREVPSRSPSAYLDIAWILVFKRFYMSDWAPHLCHPMQISPDAYINYRALVPDPPVYWLHSTHFIYLNIRAFEVDTNPAVLYQLSVDSGTGHFLAKQL